MQAVASLHNSRKKSVLMSIWRQTKKPWYYISRVTLNEHWNWLEPLFRSLRIKFVNLFLDVLSMLNFLPTSNALNGWPKDLCYINQNATTRKIKLYCKIYRLLCKSEAFNSLCSCLRECTKSKFAFLLHLRWCNQSTILVYSDQCTSTDIFNPSLKEFLWVFIYANK